MPRLNTFTMKFAPIPVMVAAIFFMVVGCSSGDITSPNQIAFPADSVSYARQVEPYFTLACNGPGCHNATDMAGGIDLSSWIGVRAINVTTPHDTTSELVLVMKGQLVHNAGFPAPTANQIEGITQWVREGAKDN